MKYLYLLFLLLLTSACQGPTVSNDDTKQQITETLKLETQYFCQRNLTKWQEQWSQKPYVSKMYGGNMDFEEFIGWKAINQFTVNHIKQNPEPIPIPIPSANPDYIFELFGDAAFVFYSKKEADGPVRETPFMVKENGKWKIARMQTID